MKKESNKGRKQYPYCKCKGECQKCYKGIKSVGVILLNVKDNDKFIILVKEKNNSYNEPGGKIEINEVPSQTISRELNEETNGLINIPSTTFEKCNSFIIPAGLHNHMCFVLTTNDICIINDKIIAISLDIIKNDFVINKNMSKFINYNNTLIKLGYRVRKVLSKALKRNISKIGEKDIPIDKLNIVI